MGLTYNHRARRRLYLVPAGSSHVKWSTICRQRKPTMWTEFN